MAHLGCMEASHLNAEALGGQVSSERVFIADQHSHAALVMSDGTAWVGQGLGKPGLVKGEICFNTSMSGYQEILTDPSYAGQIITFTFPHIGNVGCNDNDCESQHVFCKGLVLRESIGPASNYRSHIALDAWLKRRGVTGLCGIDTRALTRNIREHGARSVLIYYGTPGESISIDALHKQIKDVPTLLGQELALSVCTRKAYTWDKKILNLDTERPSPARESVVEPLKGPDAPIQYHVVAFDFGIKHNILRCLAQNNFRVTVVPGDTSFEEVMSYKPDGIFLSNGPGDPFATYERVGATLKHILNTRLPVFGICLGNQLLALTCGLNTLKLYRGHRGGNHPVKNLKTGKVEITSQNHGFCVSKEVVPDNVEITHLSLFDNTIEGVRRTDRPAFVVQYHPESSPGPHDSQYLFQDFRKMIEASKKSI